jgi:hypothetical protein
LADNRGDSLLGFLWSFLVQFVFPKELIFRWLADLNHARHFMLINANYMLFALILNDLLSEFLFSGCIGH